MRLLVLRVVAGLFFPNPGKVLMIITACPDGPWSNMALSPVFPRCLLPSQQWLPGGCLKAPQTCFQQGAWPVPRSALCLQTVLFIHSFLSSTNLLLAPSVKWQKSLWRTQQVPLPGSRPPDPDVEPPRRLLRSSQTEAFLSRTEALSLLASQNLGAMFLLGVKQYTAIWKYTQACTWYGKVNTNNAKGEKRIRQEV